MRKISTVLLTFAMLGVSACRGPSEIQGLFEDSANGVLVSIDGESVSIQYQGNRFEFPDFKTGFSSTYNELKRSKSAAGFMSPALKYMNHIILPNLPHYEEGIMAGGIVGEEVPGLFDIYLLANPRKLEGLPPIASPVMESYMAELFYFQFKTQEEGLVNEIQMSHSIDGIVLLVDAMIDRSWQIGWSENSADHFNLVRIR